MNSKPKKILIVEDERPLSRALELKLSNIGFKTRVAYDGEEALDFIKKDKFDLMLLDLVVPNISGFDVLLRLRQSKNKIPIIITSNLGQGDDLKKAQELGTLKYFIKSDVGIAEIVNYVKDFLDNNLKNDKDKK
ncbi:response regulator [Candidatus Falkowbacteria bacterium HGW-Falkowbacteria-1]|jgi:DNA-binding response OmpR family regulator|uniref:Response regulator n=1 Tax=Candidatus Falkowbacteria bacterium HGW-Falkowbacteria-1 TaxID=2013768 RepID=A0A2N2EAK5_9BACT|nr:MAG: response regulator [Candidatus Falkowbacteria bacterium HGW-Falkowbacteria-1]